jgi:hypothetical protein
MTTRLDLIGRLSNPAADFAEVCEQGVRDIERRGDTTPKSPGSSDPATDKPNAGSDALRSSN